MRRHSPSLRNRRGFSLVELLITMTMVTVVGAAIVSVFTSQQRFVRATSDLGTMRTQLQTAATLLPADLRNISTSGLDILAMSSSEITVRSTIATSVVCSFTPSASGNTITLAPSGSALATTLHNGSASTMQLTSVLLTPAAGDSAFIWDDGATNAASDDRWVTTAATGNKAYAISSVTSSDGACVSSYAPSGNSLPALVLTINTATPLRATLTTGAPVRVTRGLRYGFYQSATDNQWYLGYRDQDFATWQYVAGPFTDNVTTGIQGIQFRYYDVNGAEITDYTLRSSVARIDVTANAQTANASSLTGTGSGKIHKDSLRVGVAIRNRN